MKASGTVALWLYLGLSFGVSASVGKEVDAALVLIDGPEVDLTLADVKKALLSVPPEVRAGLLRNRAELHEAVTSTYLTKVAAHRALQKELHKNPEVEAVLWNRRLNILAGAELDAWVAEKLAGDSALEAVALEEYLANPDDYKVPESVEASHILIKSEGDGQQEARARIAELRQRIVAGELEFAEAARAYSQDAASAPKGGALGRFPRGKMVKPFEEAVFSLKVGEVSQPVETSFGYHLILVTARLPEQVKPFDEVKDALMKKVREKLEARIRRDYWLRLENDPDLKMNEAQIERFLRNPRLD